MTVLAFNNIPNILPFFQPASTSQHHPDTDIQVHTCSDPGLRWVRLRLLLWSTLITSETTEASTSNVHMIGNKGAFGENYTNKMCFLKRCVASLNSVFALNMAAKEGSSRVKGSIMSHILSGTTNKYSFASRTLTRVTTNLSPHQTCLLG